MVTSLYHSLRHKRSKFVQCFHDLDTFRMRSVYV